MNSLNTDISHMTNETKTLRGELQEAHLKIKGLRDRVSEREEMLAGLRVELETPNADFRESRTEVETLRREVKVQTAKAKRFWTQKCEQLLA